MHHDHSIWGAAAAGSGAKNGRARGEQLSSADLREPVLNVVDELARRDSGGKLSDPPARPITFCAGLAEPCGHTFVDACLVRLP